MYVLPLVRLTASRYESASSRVSSDRGFVFAISYVLQIKDELYRQINLVFYYLNYFNEYPDQKPISVGLESIIDDPKLLLLALEKKLCYIINLFRQDLSVSEYHQKCFL